MLVSVNAATLIACSPPEYEQTIQAAAAIMSTQSGYERHMFLRSTTTPGFYATVLEWSDAEQYDHLDELPELMELFERFVSLTTPESADRAPDRIRLEHHKADVVDSELTSSELGTSAGTAVCLNRIRLLHTAPADYEAAYREGAGLMSEQPGHLRHKLVRSWNDPTVYYSIAEWATIEDFRALTRLGELAAIFAEVNKTIAMDHHICEVVHAGSTTTGSRA